MCCTSAAFERRRRGERIIKHYRYLAGLQKEEDDQMGEVQEGIQQDAKRAARERIKLYRFLAYEETAEDRNVYSYLRNSRKRYVRRLYLICFLTLTYEHCQPANRVNRLLPTPVPV